MALPSFFELWGWGLARLLLVKATYLLVQQGRPEDLKDDCLFFYPF